MSSRHVAHLVLLGMWAGLVLAETVIEFGPRVRPELWPASARFHFWMDMLIEAPILIGVVVTGTLLLLRVPLDAALAVKSAAGLLAVGANAACMVVVVRRARPGVDAAEARRLSAQVVATALLGLPCALAALVLGWWRLGY
jgi:hypothetical protein